MSKKLLEIKSRKRIVTLLNDIDFLLDKSGFTEDKKILTYTKLNSVVSSEILIRIGSRMSPSQKDELLALLEKTVSFDGVVLDAIGKILGKEFSKDEIQEIIGSSIEMVLEEFIDKVER